MKLSMKTVVFQELVSRAIKGAGQNKLIPITSLMAIEVKDGKLRIITTDASNYLYIKQEPVTGNDFYVVVPVEQFSKLISKMTSENISLELDETSLVVKGNGTYKIELTLDEEGNLIQYPDPLAELSESPVYTKTVKLTTIKTILATNKASLAVTMEEPAYTGYYVADKVITTDSYKLCALNVPVLDKAVLVSPETMDLLDVMTVEDIDVDVFDDLLVFGTKDCTVYGHKMEGLDDFDIAGINRCFEAEFTSNCKISKTDFLAALDRVSLFVSKYDNKAVTLTFTDKGLNISSKASTGNETLAYMDSNNFTPYMNEFDFTLLVQQLKAYAGDSVNIYYGHDAFLKFVDGNVIQLLSIMQEETPE